MKKVLLTTCNAKYIHKNLALRWLFTSCPNHKYVMMKEYTIKDDVCRIVKEICDMDTDIVCFSCYIWNIDMTIDIIKRVKKENPQVHILVGGPEVSYDSFDLLNQGVDAISIGEGEESIWEYVAMIQNQSSYDIKGIYTKEYPNTIYRKTDMETLVQYQDPYFLDFDKEDMGKRYLYLETSRGCPYGCTYCLSSADRQVRMFSLDYVLGVLKNIANSDIRQVKLLDRTFNADPQRALQIARYMNENCTSQIFQFEIVAETLSEDLLTFFCEEADKSRFRFEIGVQSFHEETLKAVGRYQNNARLKEVIRRLKEAGCVLHVDLIAGLPYEDYDCFHASFDELFELHASELQLGILKLLKGTKLRSQKDEFAFSFHVQAPYDIRTTKWMSEADIQHIHRCADAVEKFYNSGTCRALIEVILAKKWYTSAFHLFMDLGVEFAKLPRPYQPYELFTCFYPLLTMVDEKTMNALLLTFYYPRFKQKPKRFIENCVAMEQKNVILHFACQHKIADQNTLFAYGIVDIGYHETMGYQLVLYNKQQQLPKQYFIDEDMTYIKEL